MKKRNRFPLIILLILSTVLFSFLGLMGRTRAYAQYRHDMKRQVLLSLPLKGIADGITPLQALFPRETGTIDEPDAASSGETAAQAQASLPGEEDSSDTQASADSTVPEDTSNTGESTYEGDPAVVPPEEKPPEENPADAPDDPQGQDEPAPADPTPAENAIGVATGAPAEDSYYADALFIGDSRTVGLSQYVPGLDAHAHFACAVSMSVFNALSAQCCNIDGVLMTTEQALQSKQFGKVYIMVGINEIGYERNAWAETYSGVIARIRELQPDAAIYIQSIMHVSSGKEAAAPVFNNAEVNARNDLIAAFANGTDIFYIDINYLLDDANGALNADLTFDGVHLTAGAYDLWYQEIKAQTR